MLSKFNLAKPSKYCVISVPLLEHYDRATQEFRAENKQLKTQTTTQFHYHESASRDLRIERAFETMKWIQTKVNSNFCKSEAKQIKSVYR